MVPEDGTGLANADSYVDLDYFQAYWLARGINMTQYTQPQREAALVLSADHCDVFFGPRYLGYKLTAEQALLFPRSCFYDRNGYIVEGIPVQLKNANCEYAKRILTDKVSLSPDPVVDSSGLQVQATFKKVGPLEKRVTYTTSSRLLPPFPKADALMGEITWGAGGGSYRA